MEFTIRVNMDELHDPTGELAQILDDVAQLVRDGETSDICINRQGSTVGGWQIND